MGGENCKDFVDARPIERVFGREAYGIRASLHALASGGGRVIHRFPIANDELRSLKQRVWKGGASTVHAGNRTGMMLVNDVVRALSGGLAQ